MSPRSWHTPSWVTCFLFLLGCSNDMGQTNDSPSAGGGAAQPPVGGAGGNVVGQGGSGGNGGDGGAGGGAIEPPPTVSAACAAPTAAQSATWNAANGETFDELSLAFTGTDVALLYAESTGTLTWNVKLQRLDPQGALRNAPILLGDAVLQQNGIGELPRPTLTLAARGSALVACWSGANGGDSVTCVRIASDDSVAAGYTAPGVHPGVALGPAGVGLVFIDQNEVRAQLLDADANATGSSQVTATAGISPFPATPVVAATADAYIADAEIFLLRFDASFIERDGESAFGWTSLPLSLAGSGQVFGAAWGALDGVRIRTLTPTDDAFGPDTRIDGGTGGTSAFTTALTRGDASFAVVWSEAATLRYAALDLSAQLVDAAQALPIPASSRSLAVTGVTDGFIAAAVTNSWQDIVVARLVCP